MADPIRGQLIQCGDASEVMIQVAFRITHETLESAVSGWS